MDHLNRVLKESDDLAARKLKEEPDRAKAAPPQSQLDQVKDAINVQLASNNEMHLLSELEAMGNLIKKTKEQQLMMKNESAASAPSSNERTKSWTSIKAEARAAIQANKDSSTGEVGKPESHSENKGHQRRPVDAVNLQSEGTQEASEEAFEE